MMSNLEILKEINSHVQGYFLRTYQGPVDTRGMELTLKCDEGEIIYKPSGTFYLIKE